LAPKLLHIESMKNRYDKQLSNIQALSIPPEIIIDSGILSNWSAAFARESSLPVSKVDWFPWSQRCRAIRQMKKIERVLHSHFPLTVWREIGRLNSEGRDKLSYVVEQVHLWLSLRSEWQSTQPIRDEIESIIGSLRGRYAELITHNNAPTSPDLDKWKESAQYLAEMSIIADKASLAWHKRILSEETKTNIHLVVTEFLSIASGVPIKESWIQGPGAPFFDTLKRFGSEPTSQLVIETRTIFYSDVLMTLIESWEQAREADNTCRKLQSDIDNIPSSRKRYLEWKAESPSILTRSIITAPDSFREKTDAILQVLEKSKDWHSRWMHYVDKIQPDLQKRSQEEYNWAVSTLNTAIDLLPDGEDKKTTKNKLKEFLSVTNKEWPTSDIQTLFERYSPDRIKANIKGLEAQVEELSFNLAKQDWLLRMTSDLEIQKSLDDLHTHYRRNQERIEEAAFPLFRKAIKAVPIWITTAQSPQSIPMLPDLFDILVIDEATQCTVTNILPLIYRAKRLAVIGDPEQLPAIPNIGPAAESALAAKFNIDDSLLSVIGHAENDLYKAAVHCLPRGRHDVVALEEHYRSHPLIIGFSNRHVYQTRLKLRTNPAHGAGLPFGSSVHGQHISGHCIRGQYNSSWQNPPEIDGVCDLVRSLRQLPEIRSRSLGIVTPFRPQMEAITEKLRSLELLDGVTVGTAHTYQGDERDIMIFSPVVAKGITDGAARWVENPKNLINVAVTRARTAFFVVADFDICRMQDGILGDLIKYVDIVKKLQNTSSDELELFSWMIVQGWNPLVHHVERDTEIDFVLVYEGKRLAIEVDGSQHDNTIEQDKARDTFLRGMGYDVLRIPGRAVRETPSLVIKQIAERLGLAV